MGKNGTKRKGQSSKRKKDKYDEIVINPTLDAGFTLALYLETLFSLGVFVREYVAHTKRYQKFPKQGLH